VLIKAKNVYTISVFKIKFYLNWLLEASEWTGVV